MAESTAGSMPKRSAAMGMSEPTVVDHEQMTSTVIATVIASGMWAPHSSARPKAIAPTSSPMRTPVDASRASTRPASRRPISPRAMLRITVVTVWEPAFPPVPISNGMKKERATTAASSFS